MKIIGNTVGTTIPKSNWDQTDPSKGDFIKNKPEVLDGVDGVTFTPSIDKDGNLSWSNDGDRENPESVNIKGPKGDDGNKGDDGYTPVKGKDYYTEGDKTEMVGLVCDSIPIVTNIATVKDGNKTTMNLTLNNGTKSTIVINYNSSGNPTKITVDGNVVSLSFQEIINQLYLFNQGDLCTAVSGGWHANNYGWKTSTEMKTPTMSTSGGKMSISLSTELNFAIGSVFSTGKVDLTNYSKLVFNISKLDANECYIGIANPTEQVFAFVKANYAPTVGLNTIDISGVTGKYTIAISVNCANSNPASVEVKSIYLE